MEEVEISNMLCVSPQGELIHPASPATLIYLVKGIGELGFRFIYKMR